MRMVWVMPLKSMPSRAVCWVVFTVAVIGKAEGGGLPAHRPEGLIHYFGHKEPEPTFVVDVSAFRKRNPLRSMP